jgi:hypothetical protein
MFFASFTKNGLRRENSGQVQSAWRVAFLSLTPGPSPFSSTKITPADATFAPWSLPLTFPGLEGTRLMAWATLAI